ncbi:MAG: hypothetical protein ACOCZ3_00505 [Bacillota bacterium]
MSDKINSVISDNINYVVKSSVKFPTSQWLNLLNNCLEVEELPGAFRKIARRVVEDYPETRVWFARQLGKRRSYIVGAGQESYRSPSEYELLDDYWLFIQHQRQLPSRYRQLLVACCRVVIGIFHEQGKSGDSNAINTNR